MLLVKKSDSRKGILPFEHLCQAFVLISILLRDEALASEPEPGDSASLIHQQQQIHDRVRPAHKSHLQAEYGHPDTCVSGTDGKCRSLHVQGHLNPGRVNGSPAVVHSEAWRVIQLSSWGVSGLGYTGPRGWPSTGYGETLNTCCVHTTCFGVFELHEFHFWDAYM